MIVDSFIIAGIILFCFMAALAGALQKSGCFAAILVGLSIYFGLGWRGLVLLFAFFISSTLWSRYQSDRKRPSQHLFDKDDSRDWVQVIANGGIAAVSSCLFGITENPVWVFVFAISLASANADTWASELGILSNKPPILLSTLKRVEPGTSGAVSILGTFSGLAGSSFIVLLALFLWPDFFTWPFVIFATIFGFLGMLIDTVIGSFWQRKTKCVRCGKITERKYHCGKLAIPVSGFSKLNNDGVNFLSNFIVTFIGGIFGFLF